jgi:transposase
MRRPEGVLTEDIAAAAAMRGAVAELRAERDALRARVGQLEAERNRERARADGLQEQLDRLKAELEEARRAAKRQAAPFRRRKRKADPKPPGRKEGHAAANRPAPKEVDGDIHVPLEVCPDCGGPVHDVREMDPQVVIDVPDDVRPKVWRYHNQSGYCPQCRKRVRSRHTQQGSTANGAAGVQVGPRLLALSVELKTHMGVTYRKCTLIFELFCGVSICAATLARAAQRIALRCEPTYRGLVSWLRGSNVVHADETGWYITDASKKAWLWVFASVEPRVTLYVVRTSRGGEVAREVLGDDFAGTLGVDGWAGYIGLRCAKGQCASHLLRRAEDLLEVQQAGAVHFPRAIQNVLWDGIDLKKQFGILPPPDYRARVAELRGRLVLTLGGDIREPANRRFANHLRNHHEEILRFLDVPRLEPTNNLAEREIRPAVVQRKVSAGNRTEAGAHAHEVLASVSRTAQRNGLRLPDMLPALLRSPDPNARLPLLPSLPSTTPAAADAETRTQPERRPNHGRDARLPHVRRGRRPHRRCDREPARAPPARPARARRRDRERT